MDFFSSAAKIVGSTPDTSEDKVLYPPINLMSKQHDTMIKDGYKKNVASQQLPQQISQQDLQELPQQPPRLSSQQSRRNRLARHLSSAFRRRISADRIYNAPPQSLLAEHIGVAFRQCSSANHFKTTHRQNTLAKLFGIPSLARI